MIPTIDPKVRYVGSSHLRGMNIEQLRQLTGAVVVQDSGDQPLVVIVPYQTYLKLQLAAQAAADLPDGAEWRELMTSEGKSVAPAKELLIELDEAERG